MNDLTHIDLFSGIGGFSLAAGWAGFRTVAFVEIDEFCQRVLKKHWPGVPLSSDIYDFDGAQYAGADLLTAGFPCQPYSGAARGRRRDSGPIPIWREMLRVIREARPTWVVIENVIHFKSLGLKDLVLEMEASDYETGIVDIPACSVGADHIRRRLWILGNSNRNGKSELPEYAEVAGVPWGPSRPPSMGGEDGLSSRMDRRRLAALGNAIVPQVAYQIIKGIAEIERGMK